MISVYFFAPGMIVPTVLRQKAGTIMNTAVDAQNPPQTTESQTDHHRRWVPQIVASLAAVKPTIPGIQRSARKGMM